MAPNEGKKRGEKGRITGVLRPEFTQKEGGTEDANAFFELAESPSSSVETPPVGNEKDSSPPKKTKQNVRFSIETQQDDDDDDETVEKNRPAVVVNSTVKKMASYKNRESIDTSDLSSVSTAPPLTTTTMVDEVEEARQDDESEDNHFDNDADEEVAAFTGGASNNNKDVPVAVDAEDNNNNDDDDGFPDNDDDDLVPPAPPQDDDDEDEEMPDEKPITQEEEIDVPTPNDNDENPSSPANDFPTDDYDDDDKEGTGFEMQDDPESPSDDDDDENPETPESVREKRRRKEERKQKLEQKKKKDAAKKKKKRKVNESAVEETSSEDETTVAPKKKRKSKKKNVNRFTTTFSPKGVPQPRTYTQIPVSEFKNDSPEDPNLRRSRRAHTKPLEWWRGESYEYGPNKFGDDYDGVKNMPVVVGISKANPTPYKPRKVPSAVPKKKAAGKKGKKSDDDAAAPAAEEPFDSSRIRAKYNYQDGKTAHLWDERFGETRGIKVIAYSSKMEARDLPLSKSRKKGEGKVVGKAAQSFHMTNEENPAYPGYIVGSLILPPKAIKDAESVGLCAQVFTVVKGQEGSIEIAFGDPEQEGAVWDPDTAERFLLSVGDNFLIPPGNSYRIQNHSKTTEALLSWTIIRHNPNVAT